MGGGLGFIAALAFQKSDNAILIFEINKNIIENLTVNLKQNNIKYNLYQKNLILDISHDRRKFYYADKYFLNNSMYLKSSKEIVLENINKNQIQNFDSFNTMIIDGEGIEEGAWATYPELEPRWNRHFGYGVVNASAIVKVRSASNASTR